MLTPISLLFGLLVGLVSVVLPIVGAWLLYKATHPPVRTVQVKRVDQRRLSAQEVASQTPEAPAQTREVHTQTREVRTQTRVLSWRERWREPAVLVPLILGALLVLLPLGGRRVVQYGFRAGDAEPVPVGGEVHELTRSDGTKIHAEVFGPAGAPTLILTHGWSTDNTEWFYAKRQLAGDFRLIVWDLPGLGQTDAWADEDFALERMATDLHTVLSLADGKPVVLVGHSIGGMINLTFCRLYPEALGKQVAGIVEVDSSYTNPVRTTKHSRFNLAIQKPLAEPVLHAMVPLSEVFRAMNWVSYQEGLLYVNNAQSVFDGRETRGQVDLVSRYQWVSSPGVVARGTLAMFHWDATSVLPHINVPVLMVVGKDDTTTLPRASEFMGAAIPKAQVQVLQVGRHYALLESNEAVDAAIAQFAKANLR